MGQDSQFQYNVQGIWSIKHILNLYDAGLGENS